MPVLDVVTDDSALTLTVTAEFAATPERVWPLYADARLIERWWGPPGWPATFLTHDLAPGGGSHYFMEGEDGTRHYGVWRVVEVDRVRRSSSRTRSPTSPVRRTSPWAGPAWRPASSRPRSTAASMAR